MPYLILRQKDCQDKSFELNKPVITIGRRPTNDMILADPFVSRDHAEVVALKDGGYEINDIGAKYPIKVNGKIVSRQRLMEGDRIKIGDSILVFKSEDILPAVHVEFVAPEDMLQEAVEIASLDSKETLPFPSDDFDADDIKSLQKDHQRLMLLYEFSKAVNSHLDDSFQLLEEVMSAAFRTLDAERGFVALVDENTKELTCEHTRDNTGDKEQEKLEVSRTIVHKVLRDGVSILTRNALKDQQFEEAESVKEYSIRSAMCVPLLFQEDVLGVLYMDNRASAGIFSQDDLVFLTAMCRQAGIALGNACLHREVVQENIRLEYELRPKFQILGESEQMKKVYKTIKKVAPSDITILIQGETGTGKELVAKAIHTQSSHSDQPFVAVNCAAIPRELIESELFGHEKGAFTGAISTREGKFQMAHGGTIFLDEVGDMSLETQAKVLRVLEEEELQRVGGTETIKVDARVIAATNQDLGKAVEEGKFREDLYYRLNVVSLILPTLQERKEDIIPLAEYFIAGRVKKVSPRVNELLLSYSWPGNVRELKNCIDRAVVLGDGELIQPEDLPHNIRKGGKVIPAPLESLEHMEEDHVIRALRQTGWNKSEAVKILGITRQTLDNKINKYKIKK
ncbi:MAG: sigma 54-interacting transcriptional regulator [Candidatus Aminicenantes bacterium]|nr:sigma 54-interacting transcriptional regulator [Candidatus Aminicenantes bacterium]